MTTSCSTPTSAKLEVGDLATLCLYTDRKAGRIIEARGARVLWQRDKVRIVNGPRSGRPDALKVTPGGFCAHVSGEQVWEVEPDPDGETMWFSRREISIGRLEYVAVGDPKKGGRRLIPGSHEFYDYNF